MIERAANIWNALRSSLWFVPCVMSLGGVVLAQAALNADAALGFGAEPPGWLFSGGPGDARNLLAALLTAMITMMTLVVSITMVVLTLAAGQYGSRMVRNFMTDLSTKVVLGVFALTIAYLMLVLRRMTDELSPADMPHLAVSLGTALGLLSIYVLLYLVHHLSRSLVSNQVVGRVADELHRGVGLLMPDEDTAEAGSKAELARRLEGPATIAFDREGYVQAIAFSQLTEAAREADVLLRLDFRPGHFITRGARLARAVPMRRGADMAAALEGAVVTGRERTPTQDIEHSIRHLVEIALRALSPGINDPFTAESVIDAIGAALNAIFQRRLQSEVHCDREGAPRVLAPVSDYAGLVGAALNQIRQAAAGKPDILIHLADMIAAIAPRAPQGEPRALLLRQLESIRQSARRSVPDPNDLADVEQRVDAAAAALRARPAEIAAARAPAP